MSDKDIQMSHFYNMLSVNRTIMTDQSRHPLLLHFLPDKVLNCWDPSLQTCSRIISSRYKWKTGCCGDGGDIRSWLWLQDKTKLITSRELYITYYISCIIHQSYISHISIIYQPYISHVSVIYQSYTRHTSHHQSTYINVLCSYPLQLGSAYWKEGDSHGL